MRKGQAIRYHEHGKPLDVLRLESIDVPNPGYGEVQVRLLAANINPSDMGMIGGSYGRLVPLPAVAGREGAGKIVAVGDGVDQSLLGRRVRFADSAGAWQEYANMAAEDLWFLPDDIPVELAAMAYVNPPTAWRMLRDAHLQRGDWVIQNAANSAVGIFVIQMAKSLGLKTINLVRREELIEPLQQLGGDVVLLDNDDYPKQIDEITERCRPRLALNSVGGESVIRLVKSLADGGRLVTFGGASFEPVRFPTRYLIFNDLSLTGFWMDRWYRNNTRERVDIMLTKIFDLMRHGVIKPLVEETYPLSRFQDALKHAAEPRLGKVLLRPDADE